MGTARVERANESISDCGWGARTKAGVLGGEGRLRAGRGLGMVNRQRVGREHLLGHVGGWVGVSADNACGLCSVVEVQVLISGRLASQHAQTQKHCPNVVADIPECGSSQIAALRVGGWQRWSFHWEGVLKTECNYAAVALSVN